MQKTEGSIISATLNDKEVLQLKLAKNKYRNLFIRQTIFFIPPFIITVYLNLSLIITNFELSFETLLFLSENVIVVFLLLKLFDYFYKPLCNFYGIKNKALSKDIATRRKTVISGFLEKTETIEKVGVRYWINQKAININLIIPSKKIFKINICFCPENMGKAFETLTSIPVELHFSEKSGQLLEIRYAQAKEKVELTNKKPKGSIFWIKAFFESAAFAFLYSLIYIILFFLFHFFIFKIHNIPLTLFWSSALFSLVFFCNELANRVYINILTVTGTVTEIIREQYDIRGIMHSTCRIGSTLYSIGNAPTPEIGELVCMRFTQNRKGVLEYLDRIESTLPRVPYYLKDT